MRSCCFECGTVANLNRESICPKCATFGYYAELGLSSYYSPLESELTLVEQLHEGYMPYQELEYD